MSAASTAAGSSNVGLVRPGLLREWDISEIGEDGIHGCRVSNVWSEGCPRTERGRGDHGQEGLV